MKRSRILLLLGLVTAFVIVIAALAWQPWRMADDSASGVEIGGPFTLTDHNGRTVTEAVLEGNLNLVYFGYTYCPDVCPTTLQDLATALDMMGENAERIQPILITVDPERDTVEVLKEYVTWFHPSLIGLTGTLEEIEAVKAAYKVYSAKAPDNYDTTSNHYLVDHSSTTYVMGPDGTYLTHFSYGEPPDEIAAKLTDLL